ncbi:Homocitrate synthase [Streptomyces glaucescens]
MTETSELDDSFHVFDTTLRDGAQREGINLTVADKLAIARHLDEFGVGFIEGGWPGANPRDTEFFARAQQEIDFQHAQLVAFGSTRRAGTTAAADPQVKALLDAGAPVITLVAKSHDRHVELALRTTLDENLEMVRDTVAHLKAQGRRVFVDCEHFFDGYRANPEYAKSVVRAASEAGADVVVLCDTNGGMLPAQIQAVVATVLADTGARLGIHAQDDTGCAVANTLAAVDAGATHVQCTANGYGERVGNANLFPVVAALELKYGKKVLPEGKLREMTRISHAIAEVVNLTPSTHQPYVGLSAFAHKAGLHASAIKVDPDLYQHIDPEQVGNTMRMLVSDMAGRASVELKGKELGGGVGGDRDPVRPGGGHRCLHHHARHHRRGARRGRRGGVRPRPPQPASPPGGAAGGPGEAARGRRRGHHRVRRGTGPPRLPARRTRRRRRDARRLRARPRRLRDGEDPDGGRAATGGRAAGHRGPGGRPLRPGPARGPPGGRPLPERRLPCFFDPRHGPSAADVIWTPEGGATREVPVCAADRARLADGLDPMIREVDTGYGRRPYWDAGPAYGPWAGGYFGGGILPGLLIGTMLGGMMATPSYAADYGAGDGEFEGGDVSGADFDTGDFGGGVGGGDFGGGGGFGGGGDFGGGF